ncbi:hypothetical protein GCM10017714_13800 [Curtobacterium pusillum]|uniref:Uncharacterized protein n=1 Tax=Curtobacterium pusillum TaxID=69373 RepID=A0AAW3TAA4_9MICO|nr:DUF6766 family protein [Curtobacterium pusillum]MBA8991585.1 hypothetical protein [Curtobacterium pusillum]NUU14250.1 hypothetical protein [Curtobacterium pusillum]GLK30641.1 hypothetical protein GCM10017610_09260 [Curtobacterium pusillum]
MSVFLRARPTEWSWARRNGLFLANAIVFLLCFAGMVLAGWRVSEHDAVLHGQAVESLWGFLTSGDFAEATFENWESEFLQMGSYVVLTTFLFQKGSSESKSLDEDAPQDADPREHADDAGAPWPVRRGGLALVLYENSLLILFTVLFAGSVVGHVIGGAAAYNEEQVEHGAGVVSGWQYLGTSQFWFESMQNWQSEFLVITVMVVGTVWLRQRGSSQSKPVAAPHAETGD